MSAPQPYVVQAAVWVTWDGEQYYVGPRTLICVVPGSSMYNAYGGAGNLQPLAPTGDPAGADHGKQGN